MTPTEINSLIDRHLEGWLEGNDNPTPLRDRIAAMIAEAEAGRDKLWQDGNAVLKQERDAARYLFRHVRQAFDDLHIQIDEYGVTGQTDGSIQAKINAVCNERDALKAQLASMTQARDDAIAAAHIIHDNKL